MTMRAKFIVFFVLIILILVGSFIFGGVNLDNSRFKNVEVVVPETVFVAVLDQETPHAENDFYMGEYQNPNGPERGTVVVIEDKEVETDFRIYVPIAVNRGGSGEFIYIALFSKTPNGLQHVSSYPIGDRVDIDEITVVSDDQIVVSYKGHSGDQALYEDPTEDREVVIDIAQGAFVLPDEPRMHNDFQNEETDELYAYIISEMQNMFIEEVGQPIEGFEPEMFLQIYDGLREEDFNNVEASQGVYQFENGELIFVFEGDLEHSAARAITDDGMKMLITNVGERLEVSLDSEGDADFILETISVSDTE